MRQTFYLCAHCGNLTAMLQDCGVPLYCCGQPMTRLDPERGEGAGEKHRPVWRQEGDSVHVVVGEMPHPMTQEHLIQWICLESERVLQYAHLEPGDAPEARFALCPGDRVRAAWAFCNQHKLWRK